MAKPCLTESIVGLETMSVGARFHSLMDAGKKGLLVSSHPDVWLMVLHLVSSGQLML